MALKEKAVDSPDAAGKADGNSVAIFNPEVMEEPDAKPKKIAKIEEVVTERKAKDILEQAKEKAKIIPSFDTVQVEPTGKALIAGRAEPAPKSWSSSMP